MAINPNGRWPSRTTAPDSDYPYGSSKNESSPGSGDGTPYEKARADDIFGFQQALLAAAGIIPSGNADTAIASQYLEAIEYLIELRAGNPGDFIFLPYQPTVSQMSDRGILLCNGGSVLDADYPEILTAWGGKIYGNVDSTHFNLPPLCGYFPRFWDNGAGIDPDAASRSDRGDGTTGDTVGTLQADELISHTHPYRKIKTQTPKMWDQESDLDGYRYDDDEATGSTGGSETRGKNIYIWGGVFY